VTRALLIANPHAARTAAETVRAVEEVLRGAGWDLAVRATGGSGDARRMAEQAVDEQLDVVAVFGGDGTTMQAAAALVGSDTALGLLPGGTGNLLAGNLRLPANPVKAAQVLVTGSRVPLDLGRVRRADGDHYFAVACGAGMDARVMGETESFQKHRWGMMAYIATTLRILPEIRNVPFRITVDGTELAADAALLLVANCGEVIPRVVRIGKGISPHDGLLDVMVLQASSVGETIRAMWDLLTDRSGTYGEDAMVAYARGREIAVRVADGTAVPVQLDGEVGGETPFTVSVVPGAIQVIQGGAPA
jgi:diacylglycerol kinase (ATP)